MATNPLLRYGAPKQIACTIGVTGEFPAYTSGAAYSGTVSIAGAQGATTVALVPPGADANGGAYIPLANGDFANGSASWAVTTQTASPGFTFQAGAGRSGPGFLRWQAAAPMTAPDGDLLRNTTVVQTTERTTTGRFWARCTAIGTTSATVYAQVAVQMEVFADAACTQFIGSKIAGFLRFFEVLDWRPVVSDINTVPGQYVRFTIWVYSNVACTLEFDDAEWDGRGIPSSPPAILGLPAGFTIDTLASPDRVRVQWPGIPGALSPIRGVSESRKALVGNLTVAVPSGFGVGDYVLIYRCQRADQATSTGSITGAPGPGPDSIGVHGFGEAGVRGSSFAYRMNAALASGIVWDPDGTTPDVSIVCIFIPASFWAGDLVALSSGAFSANPPALNSSAWAGDKMLFSTIWWGLGDASVSTPYPTPNKNITTTRSGSTATDTAIGLAYDVLDPANIDPAAFTGTGVRFSGCLALRLNSTANDTSSPATSTLANLDLESGDSSYLKGAGWTITNAAPTDAGSWSAKYSGLGQSSLTHLTMAPVTPGTSITASCRVSKGNNRKDFGGGAVLLEWLDANTRSIGFNVGNVVNTGTSSFQTSSVTATAPAGAAFVRLGASGTRDVKGRASDIIAVDTFAWNHTFALGGSGGGGGTATPTTGPVSLTFRVTDSVGCSAVATRVIEQASVNSTALSIYNKIREWFTFDTVASTVTGAHAAAVLTIKTAFAGSGTRAAIASPKTNGVTFTGRDVGGAGLGQGFGTDYGGAGNAGQQEDVSVAAICRRRTGASSASNFSDIALCMGTTFTSGAATQVIGIGRNGGNWSIDFGESTSGTSSINAGAIIADSWQLVVGTFAYSGGNNGTVRGYLNGAQAVPAGQSVAGTRTRAATSAAYTVGGILARTNSEFRNPTHDLVDFDEVAFFNGVLTQPEIDYLHNGGSFRSYQEIKTAAGF